MGLHSVVYNALFKRTSTFMLSIMAGTFFFERTFDILADNMFDSINKGRLWKDIEHKYKTEE